MWPSSPARISSLKTPTAEGCTPGWLDLYVKDMQTGAFQYCDMTGGDGVGDDPDDFSLYLSGNG